MIRSYLIAIVSVLVLLACDKQKSTSNRLNGDWELKQYKLTLLDGITEYAVCEGQLNITSTDFEDWNNAFTLTMSYDFPSISGSSTEKGFYRIEQKGDFMDASYRDSGNNETYLLEYRIMVLNRTDLQVEYRDTNGMVNYLTFKRIK